MALQLRIEPDQQGLMVINANTVLYLNETATAYAYFFMQGLPTDAALKKVRRMYRVDAKTAKKDYEKSSTQSAHWHRPKKSVPYPFST
ncbi:MAG: hypothetical protein QMD13_05660 [Candidatus Bathyarchaeia archaeon]|nr:hypothetical protein [Candidatus Bathyarchaeia archaeon]MDI6904956.1 hypothetical protein [Candidatus Bathyarchaeia archaeon]